MIIKRRAERIVQDALNRSPSVALIGPRQVGKTTIAFNISEVLPSVYLDLESRLDLEKVRDITAFHQDNNDKLIILDEVQRLAEVFNHSAALLTKKAGKEKKQGNSCF